MPEVKKALSNTWFDTAASSYLYDRSIYEQVIRLVGSDRVLFGSDYPLLPQKRCIQDIINLGLPEEDSLRILGLNAMKLFAEKDAG
jgi:predicted TIM-barrel fold metal-dependent hydrolase